MRIEVTEEDIARGVPAFCRFCPVARAIKRATGTEPRVTEDWVDLSPDSLEQQVYFLPIEVTTFIARFDDGQPVAPFAFDLPDAPDAR